MVEFLSDLKCVYSISIVKPTWVYRGMDIQDFINLKHDFYSFKFKCLVKASKQQTMHMI